MYKKFNLNHDAVKVLLYKLNNVRGSVEFAEKINTPEVWTEVGKAQLDQQMVKEAIESFIKAQNPSMYMAVINIAQT